MHPYPLFSLWPKLERCLPRALLGDFPSPLERLSALETEASGPVYLKRDDLSSRVYGGNKVRTLEMLFGEALSEGKREIVAVGAVGSNHAVATVLHAPRVGLLPGAILFPQPYSATASENLRETMTRASRLVAVPHWSLVPFAMRFARREGTALMLPGGATPTGALGYVAAALELGLQIKERGLEPPRRVYVGIGSTCTTAGLLVGFRHAARLGLGFREVPSVVAVRVTPWPITSRFRVLNLAARTARRLAELAQDRSLDLDRDELGSRLELDGSELGAGYGRVTERGRAAIDWFQAHAGYALDTTYSAKAAAAFLRAARRQAGGPHLFWSTKSTAPLPTDTPLVPDGPRLLVRWLRAASTARNS